jgi:hypothetical protein
MDKYVGLLFWVAAGSLGAYWSAGFAHEAVDKGSTALFFFWVLIGLINCYTIYSNSTKFVKELRKESK